MSYWAPRCVLLLISSILAAHSADTLTIRLATLAPQGSSFHKSLQRMGEAWRKTAGESVKLTIFPDGVQGGEADVVRKMRAGKLAAGLLTGPGLAEIEPAVTSLQSVPLMYRSFDELEYVGRQMQPLLEKKLHERGFEVLFWADAGWVRFFTRKPVTHPDDLRSLKLFVWQGNNTLADIWRTEGFKPQTLEPTDIAQGLRTGLIEAVAVPPVFAVAAQINDPAPHMLDLKYAPLIGACVVRSAVWESLPAAHRAEFQSAAAAAGTEIRTQNRAESEEAVKAMERRGLKVQKVASDLELEWRSLAEKFYPKLRGAVVPADLFDRVSQLLAEYRSARSSK